MLASFLFDLSAWTLNLLNNAGYLGIFLVAFLDRALMNWIPAEVVLPLMGLAISRGFFSFWLVVLTTSLGGVLGDWLIFSLARRWGRLVVEKYGRFLFLGRHELQHGDELFRRYGDRLVFFGRFMPIVRAFVAIPAGIARVSTSRFLLYSALGSLPANLPFIYAGEKAGENWHIFSPYLRFLDFFALTAVMIFVVWYIYKHWKKKSAVPSRLPQR